MHVKLEMYRAFLWILIQSSLFSTNDKWLLLTGEAHQSGLRHERGRRLWFDVSEVPVGERIVRAELRLFQFESSTPQRATVTVYQLVADGSG